MTDKIAEIRARHKAGDNVLRGSAQMHDDRGYLLDDVERLREIISTLDIVGKAADDERARMQKEIERLHKAHETACLGGELLRGEVERLRAEKDLDTSSLALLRQEIGGLARERDEARAEVERLHAELRAMTAGFEVAYHALGAKP